MRSDTVDLWVKVMVPSRTAAAAHAMVSHRYVCGSSMVLTEDKDCSPLEPESPLFKPEFRPEFNPLLLRPLLPLSPLPPFKPLH